ncbi:MAG: hypothetical protein WCW13_00665 [archaeon]|jgi:hypothetical protein
MPHRLFSLRGRTAAQVVPKAVEARKKVRSAFWNGGESSINTTFFNAVDVVRGLQKGEKSEKGTYLAQSTVALADFASSALLLRVVKETEAQRVKANGAANMILYTLSAEMARDSALLKSVVDLQKKFVYVDAKGRVFFTNVSGPNRMLVKNLIALMGGTFTESKHNGVKTGVRFVGTKMELYNPATKGQMEIDRKEITNATISKNAAGKEIITFDTPSGAQTIEVIGKTKANVKGWFGLK